MRTYKAFIFIKTTALTLFAMVAGAGCCYRIMAEPQLYIMPVEPPSHEILEFLASTETCEYEPDALHEEPAADYENSTTTPTEQITEVAPEQPVVIYDIPLPEELQHGVRALADRYEVSYELVLAMIMTESSGRPELVGDGGDAIGLMQIQPKWHGELMAESGLSVDKPIENVELGILILLGFIEENDGNLDRALKQYNSGNPDYPGNEYVESVRGWLDYFEEAADDRGTVNE